MRVLASLIPLVLLLVFAPPAARAQELSALARLDGHPVGLIATNPLFSAGAMGPDGCAKCTSFIALCDSFNIPLVFVHDTPGFFVGKAAELRGMPGKIINFIEALSLATKAGGNPELVYQAIRGGLAGSTVLDAKAPMVLDRNFKPGFRIDLHIKDLANALDTSHGIGAHLPLTAAVMEMMQALKVDGQGTSDHSALACYYEKLAKVEITR